ncbi:DUF2634 domain-containing protein [Acetanaerobacterium elongatum]|uniref:DUF2634 domain-containing protein n=1 Tax=Acetanaerobacterium elongatum TaxID=258515 RepID=UPI0013BE9B6C|nr:DUF2634 domain-containing protein [Acetanaerobacterium elongatum]
MPQLGYLNTSTDYTHLRLPSKTYKLDINSGHIRGHTDELSAMEQAVYKILATERFWYHIYTPNYGVELDGLVGSRREYIKGDIARRLSEALTADDRITGIRNLNVSFSGEEAGVSFIVGTIYGDVIVERRVALG